MITIIVIIFTAAARKGERVVRTHWSKVIVGGLKTRRGGGSCRDLRYRAETGAGICADDIRSFYYYYYYYDHRRRYYRDYFFVFYFRFTKACAWKRNNYYSSGPRRCLARHSVNPSNESRRPFVRRGYYVVTQRLGRLARPFRTSKRNACRYNNNIVQQRTRILF